MHRPLVPTALGLVLAAAIAAPTAAQAQANPQSRPMSFYATLSGGISSADIDCTGVPSCKRDGTAFKLVGGFNINDGLSAEMVYASLGTATLSDPSMGVSIGVKGAYFGLGLAGHYDVNNTFAALIRGGLATGSAQTTTSVTGVGSLTENRSGTNHWYYGLGARVYLTRNWRLDFDYDRTRVAAYILGTKTTNDVGAFMAGGSYAF